MQLSGQEIELLKFIAGVLVTLYFDWLLEQARWGHLVSCLVDANASSVLKGLNSLGLGFLFLFFAPCCLKRTAEHRFHVLGY